MKMTREDMARANLSQRRQDGLAEVQKVWQLLDQVGLEDYSFKIIAAGYETVDDVKAMTHQDLEECGVRKQGHIKRFMRKIETLHDAPHAEPLARSSLPVGGRIVGAKLWFCQNHSLVTAFALGNIVWPGMVPDADIWQGPDQAGSIIRHSC